MGGSSACLARNMAVAAMPFEPTPSHTTSRLPWHLHPRSHPNGELHARVCRLSSQLREAACTGDRLTVRGMIWQGQSRQGPMPLVAQVRDVAIII